MLQTLYADMLEYRQQMYEGVPFAYLHYQHCIDLLWSLPLEMRVPIMDGDW